MKMRMKGMDGMFFALAEDEELEKLASMTKCELAVLLVDAKIEAGVIAPDADREKSEAYFAKALRKPEMIEQILILRDEIEHGDEYALDDNQDGEEEPLADMKGTTMKNETKTTKTMTERELAEAIVNDRITRGQFGEDDRDWLVEREMRETRESLVNGFNAIEHWNEADDDDEYEDEDEGHSPFDGNTSDLGDLLGDFEWQYDIDALVDMLTITTPHGAFWLRDDEVPEWNEVDDACMWAPITENIEHILEWYNTRADTEIVDVDDEMVLDALTKGEGEHRIWKSLTCSKVEDIIYDLALLTSDNIGCLPADEIDDEHRYEMYEVIAWAAVCPLWIEPDEEQVTLGKVWFTLVDDPYGFPTWKHLTRAQVAEIVDDVLA